LQRNNGTEKHIKETVKKVMCAMKQVEVGQRRNSQEILGEGSGCLII